MVSPLRRLASSAEMVRVLTVRLASLRASLMVLEPSRAMIRAKSSTLSANDGGGLEQDLATLVGGHLPGGLARREGRGEGGLDIVVGRRRNGVDERVVEGIADVDGLGAIDPLAGEEHLHRDLRT